MRIPTKFIWSLLIAAAMMLGLNTSKVRAQNSCEGCQGQCQYCVDQQCTPKRQTFGHYQTNWRRWPVPPPSIPVSQSGQDGVGAIDGQDLDLPAVEDEGEGDPDLSHRRERAQGLPSVEAPMDAGFDDEFNGGNSASDPFRDDAERVPMPAEGSTSRSMPRHFPRGPKFTVLPKVPENNPLRLMAQRSAEEPLPGRQNMTVGFNQPLPSSPRPITSRLARPYYSNPLR